MKKIPTILERDWDGTPSRVTDKINPAAQWVFDGEGVPTLKMDGTCCMFDGTDWWKRREVKGGKAAPAGFVEVGHDAATGKGMGWVPITDAKEDQFMIEAIANTQSPEPGTYEFVGPKSQGDKHEIGHHTMLRHGDLPSVAVHERTFEGVKAVLAALTGEGIVYHHPDGSMAKIKRRDFGLDW